LPAAADGSATDKLTGSIFVGRVIDQSPAADGTSILVNVDVRQVRRDHRRWAPRSNRYRTDAGR
jgi:hypothetical protein